MTNREYLINLLMDDLEEQGIVFSRISIDDGGASAESMVRYHISCPYYDGDPRCRCNSIIVGDSIPEELCSECKYEWLDSEVEE